MIKENLAEINKKINDACIKSGRNRADVKLMAVSKFHPAEAVLEAIDCGQFLFGENRVQEANEKFPAIKEQFPQTKSHMIGQLQSNKVKIAVTFADCIQSVDRIDLIKEIEKQCAKINKTMEILFEIHTGEDSKSGFDDEKLLREAIDFCAEGNAPHVVPKGFMTMAPFTEDKALIHKSFASLRELSDKLKIEYPQMDFTELSMGMSGDFEIAIEEGSTLVRIGTAIFGERDYSK